MFTATKTRLEDSERNTVHRQERKTVSIRRTKERMKFMSGTGKWRGAKEEFIMPKTINKQSLKPGEEINNNPISQKTTIKL